MGRITGWKKKNKTAWISIRGSVVNAIPEIEGKEYIVYVESQNVRRKIIYGFNSNSKARRYAIRWMKAHPRG